jgi:hypothetical protein
MFLLFSGRRRVRLQRDASILRFIGPTRFFEGAYRDRVCVGAFIWVSVRLCI